MHRKAPKVAQKWSRGGSSNKDITHFLEIVQKYTIDERTKETEQGKKNERKERKIDTDNIDKSDYYKRDIDMMSTKIKAGLDQEKLH